MSRRINLGSSLLASQLRGWRGTSAFQPVRRQPQKSLELFEFEASPYCRLVREALTELDLDALIYPCPKHGTRSRPQAQTQGGKTQFPFLVDPNTGVAMFESAAIINYLAETYEGKVLAASGLGRRIAVATSLLTTVTRGGLGGRSQVRGLHARPSKAPAQPLELYSFESSPYSRPVREVLCELELPYLLRNTGKARWRDMGSPRIRDLMSRGLPVEGRNRKALLARTGKVQVPYLIDPNTGVEMFESADIIQYLEATYAA